MRNFDVGEKSLWQMQEQMFFIVDGMECDIESFMLTNYNLRVKYLRKTTPFNKVLTDLLIPLSSIKIDTKSNPCISHFIERNCCKLSISTTDICYEFHILVVNYEMLESELSSFYALVLKNTKK